MVVCGINKVIFVGCLGKDLEVCYIFNGGVVVNLQVVMLESWCDKQMGEMWEQIEWYCVVLFGKFVEVVGECLCKGVQVCIEGQFCICSWEDNGIICYVIEIFVKIMGIMQMLVCVVGVQIQLEEG